MVRMVKATPVRRVITKTLHPAPRGKGTGRGAWVFVPENANLASVLAASLGQRQQGGKQNGKGQGRQGQLKKPVSKFSEKLRATDPSLKVWVGNLSKNTTWKELEQHFATVAKPAVTDIMRNGTAVLAYKTVEDVEAAVATLNGSELKGASLEVDVWVQKPKTEKKQVEKQAPKEAKQPPAGKLVKKLPVPKQRAAAGKGKVAKGTGKGKTAADDKNKMKEKLAAFSATQKVWIGGLSEGTTWKELEAHLGVVAKPKLTHVFKATGVAAYEAEEDVLTVITALDGSELNGNTLQVDHWTMPERKGKKGEVKAKEEIA
mmetsp:Transcript_60394/g.124996  ORF Transcript_60394/g.124996 Transcript_60394/m.124996 type:complete len:317 (-) Transcript_60394:87-1037(-)